eukprot:TRINITY_DN843_c0_g1_i9.p1 TRINITY_DN843_c0_g1~~TRINITY_DN843_c0_g1_i9.p1  ORF type:complete len:109 (+),score=22.39 TRINITY_DN843_c0_g1_i9:71-397(+)
MSYHSERAEDGQVSIKLSIQTGWIGFNNQWMPTSTYKVAVSEQEPFYSLIEKLKEQTGPVLAGNVDKIYAVDGAGHKIKLDFSKTCKENGITHTKQVTLRFPNTVVPK